MAGNTIKSIAASPNWNKMLVFSAMGHARVCNWNEGHLRALLVVRGIGDPHTGAEKKRRTSRKMRNGRRAP